ncbi:hypothetical protein ACIBU0_43930 [Streptomyces sp. NPDC049627]
MTITDVNAAFADEKARRIDAAQRERTFQARVDRGEIRLLGGTGMRC